MNQLKMMQIIKVKGSKLQILKEDENENEIHLKILEMKSIQIN